MTTELQLSLPPAWTLNARCAETDPDVFYPDKGKSASGRQAKKVCNNGCPVIEQCLAYALANNEQDGVWGGLSARERILLTSRRKTRVIAA